MVDGFDRLRHDAVVGGDHQHDDVGDLGAARAHRGEGGVAGRVEEGDLGAGRRGHLIGADMLGDAAGFAGDHVGRADGVEQRGLAVVDVTHDGDHRRARQHLRRIVGHVEQALFDVGFRHAADRVAHFLGDQLGGVGVDHVVDLQHLSLLHQQTDHIDRALGHAVGKIGNRDRLGDCDFTHELFFRLGGSMALEPLRAATERRDRTFAHFVGAQRRNQRQAAAFLHRRATRRGRTCGGRTRGAGTARHTRRFVVVGFKCEAGARSGTLGLFLAETFLGDFVGLALGFLVVLAAVVFLALARFRGLTLGLVDDLAGGTAAGLFLGNLALFRLADA